MYELLDMSLSRDLCWWTAAIMAFRGLLRKAHVTVSNQVTFKPWGVLLRLNRTKTIQYGEGSLEIPFSYAHDSIFYVATYQVWTIRDIFHYRYISLQRGFFPLEEIFPYFVQPLGWPSALISVEIGAAAGLHLRGEFSQCSI